MSTNSKTPEKRLANILDGSYWSSPVAGTRRARATQPTLPVKVAKTKKTGTSSKPNSDLLASEKPIEQPSTSSQLSTGLTFALSHTELSSNPRSPPSSSRPASAPPSQNFSFTPPSPHGAEPDSDSPLPSSQPASAPSSQSAFAPPSFLSHSEPSSQTSSSSLPSDLPTRHAFSAPSSPQSNELARNLYQEDYKNLPQQPVALDGDYWATFDPNQKRQRERKKDTVVDQEYWVKRNSRPKKTSAPPSDDQLAKRLERQKQIKEENRKGREEEHERMQKKHQEAQIGKEIFPGIFLGGKHVAKNWEFFVEKDVKAVINMTTEVPNYHEKEGLVEYLKVEVSDLPTENLGKLFDRVTEQIRTLAQKGNVLIHCKEGKSRSPTISIAYAMKHLNMSLAEAYASITTKSNIRINHGFQEQLMIYEQKIFNTDINTFNFLKKRNSPDKDETKKTEKQS